MATSSEADGFAVYSDGQPVESSDFNWRLFRGQATDVLSHLPDDYFDAIWTDPPYLLSSGGITCHAGRMVSVDKGEWDKSQGWKQDLEFTEEWMAACYRVLKPTGSIWVSGTMHYYPIAGMALIKTGFRILNDITWEKPNPPPNLGRRTFTHSTELIYWAAKSKRGARKKYVFNYEAMKNENGGKQMKTVWQFRAPGRDEKQFGRHPTQKPVALIERCIRASTNVGDLVLDPFAGSGSTGVAALNQGRRFVGIEVEREFIEIASKRLYICTPPSNREPRKLSIQSSSHGQRLVVVSPKHAYRRCHGADGYASIALGRVPYRNAETDRRQVRRFEAQD